MAFKISIGCSLKKYRSSHRLAPFTSIPTIGTKAKRIKEAVNNGKTSLISNSVFINEIKIIIPNAKNVKNKCFVKKSNSLYLIFHQQERK